MGTIVNLNIEPKRTISLNPFHCPIKQRKKPCSNDIHHIYCATTTAAANTTATKQINVNVIPIEHAIRNKPKNNNNKYET